MSLCQRVKEQGAGVEIPKVSQRIDRHFTSSVLQRYSIKKKASRVAQIADRVQVRLLLTGYYFYVEKLCVPVWWRRGRVLMCNRILDRSMLHKKA